MQLIFTAIIAAIVFAICYAVDKCFTKLFRSKQQHRSGKAVKASKRYSVFGLGLILLGILAICIGVTDGAVLTAGGVIVLAMGIGLTIYYLSFGIYYDDESLLYCRFGKPDLTYSYTDIVAQQLYMVQGGNIIVELHMADGSAVSVHSLYDGMYPFLDHAFSRWSQLKGLNPQDCDFYDPRQCLWFPPVEAK